MEVTIALEQRFCGTPDGRVWTQSVYPRPFWSRYLSVFDGVRVLARVHRVREVPESWKRVDGDGVTVAAVPAYVGPFDFVRNVFRVRAAVSRALGREPAILLRVPGVIATLARTALPAARPYGVEVLGDPYDAFSPGGFPHPLRPFFRWWFRYTLRGQCRDAACHLYVTEYTLQQRYPPGRRRTHVPPQCEEGMLVSASDVELPDEAFAPSPGSREPRPDAAGAGGGRRFRLVFIGTLEVPYKALDVAMAALAESVRAGVDAELAIIGTGRLRASFESLGRSLGISDRLMFLGSLPAGEAVRQQLDASDLFVLSSRVEGLPRALMEAMARGLPCIGTRVGGIPELLPDDAMVAPGDAGELARKIIEVAANPARRAEMAARNLSFARRYHEDVLQPRRLAFYRCLRELTAACQRGTERRPARFLRPRAPQRS
jgi:glycosyltransferase involved in cell wall biosynthesis